MKFILAILTGLCTLQGLRAEGPGLQSTLAGAGLVAGAIELSFAPVWSNYIRSARSTDQRQLLIQTQTLNDGFTGTALVTQILRDESRLDLKQALSLRSQAYGGAALLFGVSGFLILGPEHQFLDDWHHPGVATFGATAFAFGMSFTAKQAAYSKELNRLTRNRNALIFLLPASRETIPGLWSYHLRLNEQINFTRKRRNESAFISFEYVSLAAVTLYGFFSGAPGPSASAFSPIIATTSNGARLGVLHRF